MGYIGNRPTAVPLTSADIQDGVITAADLGANSVDSSELVDGSIDTSHLADNQVTLAKMAGLARGKLIYGDTSGDPAALAVGSANEVLTHDGTDFDWAAAAGGDNTPSFLAYRNSTQAIASATTVVMVFNTEAYDTDSAYDTTTGRFTVPAGEGGKYFFTASYVMAGMGDGTKNSIALLKNGSHYSSPYFDYDSNSPTASTALYNRIIGILTLSAADYIQVYTYQNTGVSINTQASQNHFGCYKLIGI